MTEYIDIDMKTWKVPSFRDCVLGLLESFRLEKLKEESLEEERNG